MSLLSIDELVIIDMCIMKEVGRNRMEMLSDSYLMDDEMYDRKERFTEALEKLNEKIVDMRQQLENEKLK